jgi:hypothetical protein
MSTTGSRIARAFRLIHYRNSLVDAGLWYDCFSEFFLGVQG